MKKHMMLKIEIHRLFTVLVHYGVRCGLPQKPYIGNSAYGVWFLILGFQVRFAIQILTEHVIFLPAHKQEFDTFKEYSLMCAALPPHFFTFFFARETSGERGGNNAENSPERSRELQYNSIAEKGKQIANLEWERGE